MSSHSIISLYFRRLRILCRGECVKDVDPSIIRNESGATLVEFTVIMPLFFLILFGIIEYGTLFFLQYNMLNAARTAARSMSVQGVTPAAAAQTACNCLPGSGQTYTITSSNSCPASSVKITTPSATASVFNYLGMFTGNTLQAQVTMHIENCQTTSSSASLTCVSGSATSTVCP
jgi:Flp pilus assembly protein TadG